MLLIDTFQRVWLTISVRNRKDPVVEFITDALSQKVGTLKLEYVRNLEELKFICSLLGEIKFEKIMTAISCELNEDIRYEPFYRKIRQ